MICNYYNHRLIIKFGSISLTFDNDKSCFLTMTFMVFCCNYCNVKKVQYSKATSLLYRKYPGLAHRSRFMFIRNPTPYSLTCIFEERTVRTWVRISPSFMKEFILHDTD